MAKKVSQSESAMVVVVAILCLPILAVLVSAGLRLDPVQRQAALQRLKHTALKPSSAQPSFDSDLNALLSHYLHDVPPEHERLQALTAQHYPKPSQPCCCQVPFLFWKSGPNQVLDLTLPAQFVNWLLTQAEHENDPDMILFAAILLALRPNDTAVPSNLLLLMKRSLGQYASDLAPLYMRILDDAPKEALVGVAPLFYNEFILRYISGQPEYFQHLEESLQYLWDRLIRCCPLPEMQALTISSADQLGPLAWSVYMFRGAIRYFNSSPSTHLQFHNQDCITHLLIEFGTRSLPASDLILLLLCPDHPEAVEASSRYLMDPVYIREDIAAGLCREFKTLLRTKINRMELIVSHLTDQAALSWLQTCFLWDPSLVSSQHRPTNSNWALLFGEIQFELMQRAHLKDRYLNLPFPIAARVVLCVGEWSRVTLGCRTAALRECRVILNQYNASIPAIQMLQLTQLAGSPVRNECCIRLVLRALPELSHQADIFRAILSDRHFLHRIDNWSVLLQDLDAINLPPDTLDSFRMLALQKLLALCPPQSHPSSTVQLLSGLYVQLTPESQQVVQNSAGWSSLTECNRIRHDLWKKVETQFTLDNDCCICLMPLVASDSHQSPSRNHSPSDCSSPDELTMFPCGQHVLHARCWFSTIVMNEKLANQCSYCQQSAPIAETSHQ